MMMDVVDSVGVLVSTSEVLCLFLVGGYGETGLLYRAEGLLRLAMWNVDFHIARLCVTRFFPFYQRNNSAYGNRKGGRSSSVQQGVIRRLIPMQGCEATFLLVWRKKDL